MLKIILPIDHPNYDLPNDHLPISIFYMVGFYAFFHFLNIVVLQEFSKRTIYLNVNFVDFLKKDNFPIFLLRFLDF